MPLAAFFLHSRARVVLSVAHLMPRQRCRAALMRRLLMFFTMPLPPSFSSDAADAAARFSRRARPPGQMPRCATPRLHVCPPLSPDALIRGHVHAVAGGSAAQW